MKKMMFSTLLLFGVCIIVAGLKHSNGTSDVQAWKQFCVLSSGQYSEYKYAFGPHDNKIGLCHWGRPFGQIEAGTFFRYKNESKSQQAVEVFFKHPIVPPSLPSGGNSGLIGMPNPASVYCHSVGGENKNVADSEGNQLGLCAFPDGSMITEWTLFLGPENSDNKMFVAALLLNSGR